MKTAYFNYGFSLDMEEDDALSCSQPGVDATPFVEEVLQKPYIADQLAKIDPDAIKSELKECGGWELYELGDPVRNQERIVWIAAGEIKEGAWQ
jgi:hypothetical protein